MTFNKLLLQTRLLFFLVIWVGTLMAAESPAREFEWAEVSPVGLSSSPDYLRSSLILTPQGETHQGFSHSEASFSGLALPGRFSAGTVIQQRGPDLESGNSGKSSRPGNRNRFG